MLLLCIDLLVNVFESFLSGLEDLLNNALSSKSKFTVVLGDLNARSPAFRSEDITTLHGTQIDSLTTTHGFKQIMILILLIYYPSNHPALI